ncbi:oligoribonuclease [Thiotrichales bacterium 19S3-7]|nr:oligoribonuclease [Thiotrichales bacterium 19S3-7]MCF6801225.1 oligoribonuclease [Thiotrichales bacterium 19S3-11]
MLDSNDLKSRRWVWIDLEMTGLNPQRDRIIEIATIVTDTNLNTIAEGPVIAISQPQSLLDQMDDWCTKTHGDSGLTKRVQQSTISEAQAEEMTLAFLREYVVENTSPMCGNSIWQDRRFLNRYMPNLEAFFHYRMLDVSTLKILAQNWKPSVYEAHNKETKHLALDDIKESIDELNHYRDYFLNL